MSTLVGASCDFVPVAAMERAPTGVEIRPVAGAHEYYVGIDGSVWKRIAPGEYQARSAHGINRNLRFSVRVGTKHTTRSLGAAVLTAFVGPKPDGHVAHHRDGNGRNNRVENLEWRPSVEHVVVTPPPPRAAADPPPPPRRPTALGPLADWIDADRRRRRRLFRSPTTAERYREIQDIAYARIGAACAASRSRPSRRPEPAPEIAEDAA